MTDTNTRLSPRLQLVFDHLIPDADVWDFCCDHGYLGGAAYKSRKFKNIYFVDPVTSIMERLELQFQKYLFQEDNPGTAFFMVQAGENLEHPVEGTACIVGVGAHTIYDILSGLAASGYLQAQRLILGPHKDSEKLLAMLKNNKLFENYELTLQKEVAENNRTRLFFIFDLRNANGG